ncbi:MAG: urate hydroxylase PuuD [Polyangiaceae bacterium]
MLSPTTRDLLDLLVRWTHVIAGIMWVGNSMLFNWLDRNLEKSKDDPERMEGRIWMVHSGGFYDVVKKQLAPNEMPAVLHWFKWQSYTTWLTGFGLLGLVYYMGGGTYLVDPQVSGLSVHQASAVGLGTLVGGFAFYDLLWRSPLRKVPMVTVAICLAAAVGVIYALTHLLGGRAAYIHVGALFGTIMAGNVFFHIIPSQRVLVAATKAGEPQDKEFALRAKGRSIHNNYMTFPLLFTMVSNHFPSTYGNPKSWLVLVVICVGGGLVRHFMNVRFTFKRWVAALHVTILAAVGLLAFLLRPAPERVVAVTADGPVKKTPFVFVHALVTEKCVPCHSSTPADKTFAAPPNGIMFDTPAQIQQYAERIHARAVVMKTMPFGNKTGMTDDQRDLLAKWFSEGAPGY